MKILLVAFGNPDNVISLSRHLSNKTDLTVLFVVSGDAVSQGIFNIDLSGLENGLTTDIVTVNKIIGNELSGYIGGNFKLWFLKTPSRKFILKKGGITNYNIIRKSISELSDHNFDVMHLNGTSGFLLYFLSHLRCRKRVWTLHDYKPHSGEENLSGVLLNRLYTKYKINYIQHYEYLKDEFAKYYKVSRNKVHTVYSGVFDVYGAFKPVEMDLPEKFMLFFGRMSAYKGLNLLINSFNSVKEETKGLHLVIAGAGTIDTEIDDHQRIMVLNRYINPNELVTLIQNSICVVTPYSDSTHSGVIMTAYAFNKPVISSRVGGIPEVVIDNETGFLFEPGNSEELERIIAKATHGKDLIEKLSTGIGKFRSEGHINWNSITDEMMRIYRA